MYNESMQEPHKKWKMSSYSHILTDKKLYGNELFPTNAFEKQ